MNRIMESESSLESMGYLLDNFDELNLDFENVSTPPHSFFADLDAESSLDGFFKAGPMEESQSLDSSYHTSLTYVPSGFEANDASAISPLNVTDMGVNLYADSGHQGKRGESKRRSNIKKHILTSSDTNWCDNVSVEEPASLSDYNLSYGSFTSPPHIYDDAPRQSHMYHGDSDLLGKSTQDNVMNESNYSSNSSSAYGAVALQDSDYFPNDSESIGSRGKKGRVKKTTPSIREKNERAKNLNNEASRKYRKRKVESIKSMEEVTSSLEIENALLRSSIQNAMSLKQECIQRMDTYLYHRQNPSTS